MFKNRFLLVLGVISLLSVTMAVAYPGSNTSFTVDQTDSDFYQRHPNWTWAVNDQNVVIPATDNFAFPDYYRRHRELTIPSSLGLGASDYFMRHPELSISTGDALAASDYFMRHPEAKILTQPSADLTDYFFRQR